MSDLRPQPENAGTPARVGAQARRWLRWGGAVLATFVILLALALGGLRLMLNHVPEYRQQIQDYVRNTAHIDLRFHDMDPRWRFYGPEVYVTDVEVYAAGTDRQLAKARAASIGIDLWRMLFRAELMPGRISLIKPEIGVVRTADGTFELEGQSALERDPNHHFRLSDLPTGRLEIVHAKLTVTDERAQFPDLILRDVELDIRRDRNDVELEGEVELPDELGSSLSLEGTAHGKLDDPAEVTWNLETQARDVNLGGWRKAVGSMLSLPERGHGNLRLQIGMKGPEVTGAKLRAQLAEVVIPAGNGWTTPALYPVIAGDFDLSREGTEWRLVGRDVELPTREHPWPESDFSVNWSVDDGKLVALQAESGFARIENLLRFATLAPAQDWREKLLQLAPEGEIKGLKVSYQAARANTPLKYSAVAHFTALGFNPMGKAPGLRGVAGEMRASEASGEAQINSRALVFNMPQKFRGPLTADIARGTVNWTHDADQWHVTTHGFEVHNPHASAVTDLDLSIPPAEESPVLKLHSRFKDAVLVEGWRYLPYDKLPEKVLAWLDAAFLAGRAPAGEFVFEGPTRSFPFRNGEGEFRITFPVEGLNLHVFDGWPALENLAVDVEFHNAGLTGVVHSGSANGLKIERAVAQFVDFKNGELSIKGHASGDAGAALGFIQKSPLVDTLGKTFADLRGSGPIATDIDILLPMKHFDDKRVTIVNRLDSTRLGLEGYTHALEGLSGTLRIEDKKVSSDGLTARYLDGPMHIELTPTVTPGAMKRMENVIRVNAITPAAALAQELKAPDFLHLEGAVDWHGVARIPISDAEEAAAEVKSRPITLRIDSALRGTAIDLPEPFAKEAAESRPLRFEVQWPQADVAMVRATYGNIARTQLRFAESAEAWNFDRGMVRLGDGDVSLPGLPGLDMRGTVDSFDLSQWLELRSTSDQPAKRALSDYLRGVELHARDFSLFGYHFADLSGSLLSGDRAWSVTVDGPGAKGTVLVPYDLDGPDALTINMTRLTLEEPQGSGSGGSEADPLKWPSVNASIGDFVAYGRHFGFARVNLKRTPQGLSFETLNSQAPSFAINGTGSWIVTDKGQQGALKLRLDSTNVKDTLLALAYGDYLTGKKMLITADVTWPGPPNAQLLGRLSGAVSVEIDDGQVLSVQPGAGRVFGLMSIAALPRRLALDFTDVVDKGLAFDTIKGDFHLETGNAFTQNLLLKGPGAEIGLVGRTGLERRDYDQTAVVTGSIGNSLPVAGALAGGPAVGAALLLFSQIFKEPLKGIARGYYRITGSWEDPVVQRVGSGEAKKQESELRTAEGKKEPG